MARTGFPKSNIDEDSLPARLDVGTGWQKADVFQEHGHEVINPALPDDDFDVSVRIAEAEYNEHHPDVVVGSSRGGAVGVNMNSGVTPLVLLCPAWKNWGAATTVKTNTVILHSRQDDVIPFADSEELVADSGLPPDRLIEVGNDHRLPMMSRSG